jgi:glycosyltransferase involved in cell wall biosynthesis
MRVLHFVEALYGGTATYLNELLPFQTEAYSQVSVLCPQGQSHLITCDGAELFLYPDTSRSPTGIFRLYKSWAAHLAENSYDIIHLHSSFAGVIGRLRLPKPRPRVVYCAHGWAFAMDTSLAKKRLYGAVERILSYRTDVIINISKDEQELARQAGIPESRCALVYNGIRDADWRPIEANRKAARLLFVGRYDRQKGIDLLVDAMGELSSRGFVLETIGGPIVGKPVVTKFPPSIVDRGWRSPKEICGAMAEADIVVMPSRWEGFGLVAAEAMRAARPVVAAAVGGLNEIVIDGETGVLCPPGSAQAIVEGIVRLANMDIRAVGENGRKRYEALFTADRMFRKIDNLYRNGHSSLFG